MHPGQVDRNRNGLQSRIYPSAQPDTDLLPHIKVKPPDKSYLFK